MPVLKGTKSFYDYEVSDQVAINLKNMFDYGLIETGAYTNAVSGMTAYTLQRVYDPRYGDDRVFEGMGPGWIWESGVTLNSNVTNSSPNRVSGVIVNGTFYSTNTSTSGYANHVVDYENGRIIFASGVDTSAIVQCRYSFKDIGVYLSDSPQWRRVVEDFTTKFSTIGSLSPSGIASIIKENRVWLPCVVIETSKINTDPLQLGGGEFANCTVNYHVFSEKAFSCKRLSDMITEQDERTIRLFDVNSAPRTYEYDGTLASGVKTYQNILDNSQYFWTFGYINETDGGFIDNGSSLYRAEVRSIVSVSRYLSTY